MNKVCSVAIGSLMLSMNLFAGPFGHHEHHHQESHQHELHKQEPHKQKHHQQKSHQHGLAEISLALEGDKVDVMLESPAANLVGFEHVASTSEQKSSVDRAKTILNSSDKLFSFVGAQCELTASEVDVSAVLGDEGKTEADVEERHGHDHHEHSDYETHSEITAHYQFHCDQGSKLTSISLGFFDHFLGIEVLKVAWVTDSGQGAVELEKESSIVYLRD